MTEFTLPPLVVDYDGRWIDVDLHGDLGDWARRAAREVLARWDARGGRREKRLTALLEAAGQVARQAEDASMVFLLYPELGGSVQAMVRFCPVDLAGNDELHSWSGVVSELFPPDTWGDDPPEATEIASPAGTCRRLRRRHVMREVGGVGEHLTYIWVFPQYGAGVIMAPSFANMEEADRWLPAIDKLAATAQLDESS
jgi:hypothetical protein